MPRVKYLNTENLVDQKLCRMLRGGMGAEGVTRENLAIAMKISPSTLHRKQKTPMDFTLRQLERACNKLNIPMSQLCECILTK